MSAAAIAAVAAGSDLYSAFEAMWHNSTFDAVKMLKNANPQQFQPENGAAIPTASSARDCFRWRRLIKADIGLEVGFLDIGGWDTHANQPGQLTQRLREFGEALRPSIAISATACATWSF